MKIGILQTAYKKADDYGKFYNVQELGLARALAGRGIKVVLYKAVDGENRECFECDGNLTIKLVSVKYLGINGLFDVNNLDSSLDALIYFSDTQIIVPRVYKWCCKHKVPPFFYVGVMDSHSELGIKRELMNFLSKRNLKIYKKCKVFTKTPEIDEYLSMHGCTDTKLLAVGLDETVMNGNSVFEKPELDLKMSETEDNSNCCKLLYIGRMEKEKQPLEMITIFEQLLADNINYSLTMIGDGYMFDEVNTAANIVKKKYALTEDKLRIVRKVAYEEMHSYFKKSDIYINLNRVEILGMSILESMYYKCPVIAIDAPGPRFILRDEYGIIAHDTQEICAAVRRMSGNYSDYNEMTENAYKHVKGEFTWNSIAERIIETF